MWNVVSKKRRKAVGQGDSDRRRLGVVGEDGKDDDKEANRQREIQGVVVVVEVLEACVRHT